MWARMLARNPAYGISQGGSPREHPCRFSGREVADVTSLLRERAGSVALAVVLAGLLMPPVAAHAAWPETPPNDPAFAPCENAATFTPNCYSDPGADQWDMFGVLSDAQYPCPSPILSHPDGGLPCWAVAAFDPDHMSGVNFTGAWAQGNVGRDDILIAYMEGGVNYSSNAIKDALDNDGNGDPTDINGWNTHRNTNDPQTEDMAYGHAPGLHSLLVGVPDNGYAGVGLCPRCRVVPVKTGAEALGRSDKWAEGLLYAADIGVTAVSSVVVNYTYSRFIQDAIDYAYDHGVVMSLDSNDFDSMDHTDGMLWDHALPGNSAAMDLTGSTTSWFRSRSNVTSYGTHNVFSGGEYTTSGATPFQAGIQALVQSAALNLRDSGRVSGFDRINP